MSPEREQFWIDVLSGKRVGAKYDLIRSALGTLSAAYSVGLEAYLGLEKIGVRRRMGLPIPVISVGNLSSGGTGKTPMTSYIARRLSDEGFKPCILSRGHGGSLSGNATQVSDADGHLLRTAIEIGDEAASLALQNPGVPVWVGKDRRQSAKASFDIARPDVYLLDDGFQYWQLARDLDIVLLDSKLPFDNGYPLPRGLLREPKEHLRRAGMIVITRAKRVSQIELETLQNRVMELAPKIAIFRANHVFGGWRPLNDAAEGQAPDFALAVCGIAQPQSFVEVVKQADVAFAGDVVSLGDHAVYNDETLKMLQHKVVKSGAKSIVTTEKDAVKLESAQFDVPVFAAKLKMEIDRPDEFWQELTCRSNLVAQ